MVEMAWNRIGRQAVAGGILLLAPFGSVACTDDSSKDASPETSDITPGSTTSSVTGQAKPVPCMAPPPEQARSGLDTTVRVFLFCKSNGGVMPVELHSVDRVVPGDGQPLRAALTQLLLGVTPAEDDAGLASAFSASTAAGLRGVTVDSGTARLDLNAGFEATNNFSTTNLAGVVFSQIEATVFQFRHIHGIEFAIDGRRWCGWEAGDCDSGPVLKR